MSTYTYKFRTLYDKCYEKFEKVLRGFVDDKSRILDLGSGNGFVVGLLDKFLVHYSVTCVDTNRKALSELLKKSFGSLDIVCKVADINKFITKTKTQYDLITCHAALHEINTPRNQRTYLNLFFKRLDKILYPRGLVIIGDFYYSSKVSDGHVKQFLQYQLEKVGHADSRERFIPSSLVKAAIHKSKLFQLKQFDEMRAIKEIDRRYYIIVLEKCRKKLWN